MKEMNTMRTANRHDILTTGQVARICHVAPRTVSKWFDTGRLNGYRIPGSRDRRIPRPQLLAFMRANGIPLDCLEESTCRVLIADSTIGGEIQEKLQAVDRYTVRLAQNKFQAGMLAQQFHPHVLVLEAGEEPDEAFNICRSVKSTEGLEMTKVILAGAMQIHWTGQSAMTFDDFLPKPYTFEQLVSAVERATNITR